MKLKPKKVDIKAGNKFLVLLHEDTAHRLDLHVDDRLKLKCGKKEITAILQITENPFPKNKIGLYDETYKRLAAKSTSDVSIKIADKPDSVIYIKQKLEGKRLNPKEIDAIIKDVVAEDLSDVELTYFVSGCFTKGLTDNETAALTKSIVNNGETLKIKDRIIMDKHCIGGVPGNRTTMIIIPIITALGLKMPKTSSRAITSPSGTADTMEVLANVVVPARKLEKIIHEIGGCIVWGGGVDLAAADDKMIKVRYPLSLDPEGMLLASIMAKKHSVGANHVLIDIPMGEQVKIKSKKKAAHLKRRFLKIAKLLGMKAKVIVTKGEEPIGNGIGPVLEAMDVMKVLKNEKDAPEELREKAIEMAGILIDMSGKKWWRRGRTIARKTLESGAAYEQMMKIIKAQGAKKMPKPGNLTYDVKATKTGKILGINNKMIARIARVAGAPKEHRAGVYLYKKLGNTIRKGQALYTVYATSEAAIEFVKKEIKERGNGYEIGRKK